MLGLGYVFPGKVENSDDNEENGEQQGYKTSLIMHML